jgi:hypothetical protein
MSSSHSSSLPPKEVGWLESGEEEEEPKSGEGGETTGEGRGGVVERRDVRGRGGRWHITERISQEIKPLDPTTVGVREGGEASDWIAGRFRRRGHD